MNNAFIPDDERRKIYDKFIPENWDNLDYDERYEALNDLEVIAAAEQNRQPLMVLPDDNLSGGNCFGYYDGERIYVNPQIVENGGVLFGGMLAPIDNPSVELIDTVLHEGRHAMQDTAIIRESAIDDDTLLLWMINKCCYLGVDDGLTLYRMQPIERDAREYASSRCSSILGDIASRHPECESIREQFWFLTAALELSYIRDFEELLKEQPELIDRYTERMINSFIDAVKLVDSDATISPDDLRGIDLFGWIERDIELLDEDYIDKSTDQLFDELFGLIDEADDDLSENMPDAANTIV